jgi:hypothetical protein
VTLVEVLVPAVSFVSAFMRRFVSEILITEWLDYFLQKIRV